MPDDAAILEFQSERVQSILNEALNILEIEESIPQLSSSGGQGLIITIKLIGRDLARYSDCESSSICIKIPRYKTLQINERERRLLEQTEYGREILKKAMTEEGRRFLIEQQNKASDHATIKEGIISEALEKFFAQNKSITRFVPKFLKYAQTEKGCFLAREYTEGEILEKALKTMDIKRRVEILFDEWRLASNVFRAFHENSVRPYVIRDFKPRNIIYKEGVKNLIMIDYGSARSEDNMISRRKLHMGRRFGGGSYLHWPLEQLIEDENLCSRKVDYFAFGVMAFYTLTLERPYTNKSSDIKTARKIYSQEFDEARLKIEALNSEGIIPDNAAKMICDCLEPEPDKRQFMSL